MSVPDTISTGARIRGSLATIDQLPPKLRRNPLQLKAPQLFTVPDIFPNGLANRFTSRIAAEAAYHVYPKHGQASA
jgi:decaprenylphospho-beta-D-ribofuranose 2-oxidase